MINGSKYIRRVYLCGVYNNMMGLMMMCALYIFFKRKDNRLFRYSIDTVCNFVVRKMFKNLQISISHFKIHFAHIDDWPS